MNHQKMKIALNMSAAAHALGIDVSEIKRSKRGGSVAFLRSGRVDLAKLRSWLKKNPAAKNTVADHSHRELAGVEVDGLLKSLQGAAEVEGKNLALLRAAQNRNDAVAAEAATAAYGKSQKNKLAIEAAVRRERIARGELMTVQQHVTQMHKAWFPLLAEIRKLPRIIASKVAPGNEPETERMIDKEVELIIGEMQRSVTVPPDADYHLNVWQAVMLCEDPTGATALTKIRAALVELEGAIAATSAESSKIT